MKAFLLILFLLPSLLHAETYALEVTLYRSTKNFGPAQPAFRVVQQGEQGSFPILQDPETQKIPFPPLKIEKGKTTTLNPENRPDSSTGGKPPSSGPYVQATWESGDPPNQLIIFIDVNYSEVGTGNPPPHSTCYVESRATLKPGQSLMIFGGNDKQTESSTQKTTASTFLYEIALKKVNE